LDIYIKVENVKAIKFYQVIRIFCVVMTLICAVLLIGGCNGCGKSKKQVPTKQSNKKATEGATIEMNDYNFTFPAANDRQLKITSKKGRAESKDGPYTLENITVSVVEKGAEVATIIAKNCRANIEGDVGTAKITGDVIITAKDKTNKITIMTEEVIWKSDSDKLLMKEFEINLNEKGMLHAANGEISTDLRSFKYDSPKLEIK